MLQKGEHAANVSIDLAVVAPSGETIPLGRVGVLYGPWAFRPLVGPLAKWLHGVYHERVEKPRFERNVAAHNAKMAEKE